MNKKAIHICSFEALPHLQESKLTYEILKKAVLEAGRFSCFEASSTNKRANLFTKLCKDPELEILKEEHGFHYPWTGVRLRTMKPKRIQRRRVKGWRMPPNTISCTRPGQYGNPFRVGGYFKIGDGVNIGFKYLQCLDKRYLTRDYELVRDNAHAKEMYRTYLSRYPLSQKDKDLLRGKDLACFCALDQPCHVDVLLEAANS